MEDTNPGGAAEVPMHPSRLENSSPEIVLEFVYGCEYEKNERMCFVRP